MHSIHILLAIYLAFIQGYAPISTRKTFLNVKMTNYDYSAESEVVWLDSAIVMCGPVTEGYGRGNKKLGVPTANLPHFDVQIATSRVATGVYFGWGKVEGDRRDWPTVVNIGRSPTFVGKENACNIVEAHLLERWDHRKDSDDESRFIDFYGKRMALGLVAYLRPEQKFNGLDALLQQINKDIDLAGKLGKVGEQPEPIVPPLKEGITSPSLEDLKAELPPAPDGKTAAAKEIVGEFVRTLGADGMMDAVGVDVRTIEGGEFLLWATKPLNLDK
jgi:riboflavin kinase